MKNTPIIKIAMVVAYIALVPAKAFADPSEGDFLGFRLGEVYPITDNTEVVWNNIPVVIVRNAQAPGQIERVELKVTAKTHKIMTIVGVAEFKNYEDVTKFADYYAALFKKKYGGLIDPSKMAGDGLTSGVSIMDHEKYRVIFNNKYHLGIYTFEGSTQRKPLMYIKFGYTNRSQEQKDLENEAYNEQFYSIINRTNSRFRKLTQPR